MFMLSKVLAATSRRCFTASSVSKFTRSFSQITVYLLLMMSDGQYGPCQAFVRQPAPTFKAPAIIDNDISSVNLEDYKGMSCL